ncbi:sigma-70 family RNA polymerase sigma factor [Azospirillum picis]|uniref:RNA polymerase sigma-70 factor (ECF subfamily) n=1 Tax=Azospirillum picis TaxID=488438 RepID=A0ABU0MMM7_9PROT|nr:sigma-70 family RNA polymerase sigma factor [Azospirillum picis]MBP2300751.1 RNA polymerase sigma-70 factor (ECF subfamily) [Azospirillum picis]MDQ0534720.1 RNA polymerase sigma-70 factor (ECF subfamily) [Azospirillum picis]
MRRLLVDGLFRQHNSGLLRFLAHRLGCRDRAADAAQEVYLRLLRFAGSAAIAHETSYLYATAANVATDLARARRSEDRWTAVDLPDCLPDPGGAGETARPDDAAAARERLRGLQEVVDALPPRCREVFLLNKVDGLSHGEIANRLGISRNMVEKHIIKALLHCRQRLGDHG